MTQKELVSKVTVYKDKNKSLSAECRGLRKSLKEMASSRDSWKHKYLMAKVGKAPARVVPAPAADKIHRHKYGAALVGMCLAVCILGNCSLRGTVRILLYLQIQLGMEGLDMPCKSSISNWVQKAGYFVYRGIDVARYAGGYALIIDECMVIGRERMLAVLIVRSAKEGRSALGRCDVEVALMKVRGSWTGAQVRGMLEKVGEKMGGKPRYVTSDGAANLGDGIRGHGVPRICDVGHEIGRLTEQVYAKDERYLAFSKASAQCKFKEVMRPTAYLLPPKQRTIARFMNISPIIKWAQKVLRAQARPVAVFTADEALALEWLPGHKQIVGELDNVWSCSEKILPIIKNRGLSHATIDESLVACRAFDPKGMATAAKWSGKVINYLEEERKKLPDGEAVWHGSSDVIESLFGSFKARKADNPLHGVTPFSLILPLLTKVDTENLAIDIDFKQALETVFLSDLKEFNTDNLIDNQVVKRRKKLKI